MSISFFRLALLSALANAFFTFGIAEAAYYHTSSEDEAQLSNEPYEFGNLSNFTQNNFPIPGYFSSFSDGEDFCKKIFEWVIQPAEDFKLLPSGCMETNNEVSPDCILGGFDFARYFTGTYIKSLSAYKHFSSLSEANSTYNNLVKNFETCGGGNFFVKYGARGNDNDPNTLQKAVTYRTLERGKGKQTFWLELLVKNKENDFPYNAPTGYYLCLVSSVEK